MTSLSDTKGSDWESISKIYKQLTIHTSSRPISKLLEKSNALLPFASATAIHDNGCGPGQILTRILSDYGSEIPDSARISASDFSVAMVEEVEKTKEENEGEKGWGKVKVFVMDAMDLKEIEDGGLSHLTAGWVYFMTPDPFKCLTESHRVLKEGAVLGLSSWMDSQWMAISNNGIKSIRPETKTFEIPKEWRTADAIAEQLEKAKFRDIDSVEVEVEMHFDTHNALVELLSEKMPHIVNVTKEWSDDEKEELKKKFGELIKEVSPSEPGRMTGTALVAVGRKQGSCIDGGEPCVKQ